MSHDIYNTGTPGPDPTHQFREPGPPAKGSKARHASTRNQRMQNAITVLVLFLIATLVVVISFQQYLLTTGPDEEPVRSSAAGSPDQEPVLADAPPPADRSPQSAYILDRLTDQSALDLGEGDKPLHSDWVKQAAYHILRGEGAYQEGDNAEALNEFERAQRIFPELQGIQTMVGLIHMQNADYEAAIQSFAQALQQGGMTFAVANNLAVAYLQQEDYDRAEQALRHAITLRPDYAPALYNLATLHVRRDEPAKAVPYFEQYMALEPDRLNVALTYVSVLMQLEEWDTAVDILTRAADQAPQTPSILFRLAQSLAQAGQTQEALATLERAIAFVDARHAQAWMSRTEFDPIRQQRAFTQLRESLATRP